MSSAFSASTIILAETSILLAAACGYIIYRLIRYRNDLTRTLQGLAKKINLKKEDRQATLEQFLKETCNYDGETAKQAAVEMITKERQFYATLMKIYMKRDNAALKNLDQITEEVINSYRQLVSISTKGVTESLQKNIEEKTQELTSTIEELSAKNDQLSGELTQLQQEMDVTVNEYASAFRGPRSPEKAETSEDSTEDSAEHDENTATMNAEPDSPPADDADEELAVIEDTIPPDDDTDAPATSSTEQNPEPEQTPPDEISQSQSEPNPDQTVNPEQDAADGDATESSEISEDTQQPDKADADQTTTSAETESNTTETDADDASSEENLSDTLNTLADEIENLSATTADPQKNESSPAA